MKNLLKANLLMLFFLFASNTIYAQSGNSTFEIFSENGDPFILIMNGIQQNAQAQTNVKAQNMAMSAYKIRVIFRETELGALNDQINLDFASHQTYVIKQKKISNLQKNLKSVSNNVALELALKTEGEAAAKQAEIENENSRFVIKMISHVPLISNAPPANQYTQAAPVQTNRANNQVVTSAPAQQTTVVQQTTTNSGNNVNRGANVSMNINLNGGVNSSSSYTETSTSTIHATGAPITTQQTNVYVLPGYSGPTGCPWPMSDGDFANARNAVNAKSFEDTKLTMAKQIFDHNCLLSAQVRDMMVTFDFEATKLEFAKYAYGRTFDIGNYYKVNDVFDFESSISDLNAYINNYRR